MGEMTGADAFNAVLQELLRWRGVGEDNKHLLIAVRALKEENAALADRAQRLQKTIDDDCGVSRKASKPIIELWQETRTVRDQLRRWSDGGRMRRQLAREHADDLDRRLSAAAKFLELNPWIQASRPEKHD